MQRTPEAIPVSLMNKSSPDYSKDFFIWETGKTWIILHTIFELRL
jgi:hypothetical protein